MPIAPEPSQSAIISPLPTADLPSPVTTIRVAESSHKDVAIDTRWTPFQSIMSYVSGSAWTVDYYSQVIDTDSQLMPQSPTVSAVHQQYNLIKGVVLKVSNPLNVTQDDDTKMMQIDGSAILNCKIIPNEGDMFLADIGAGESAIFRVKSTKKNSIFKEAVYEIEYAMSTTESTSVADLEQKVVNTYVFRRDFLTHGMSPVILEEDNATMEEMGSVYSQLVDYYFSTFFDNEFCTITIPGQEDYTYDPFLVRFLLAQFNRDDHFNVQRIRGLDLGDDPASKQDCIWEAISKRDKRYLKNGFTRAGIAYTSNFERNPMLDGIRYSGINRCVYPINPRIGAFGLQLSSIKTVVSATLQDVSPYTFYTDGAVASDATDDNIGVNTMFPPTVTADTYALNSDGTVDITTVMADDYYVLSEKFYTGAADMSVLEKAVTNYLNKVEADSIQLIKTAELVRSWGVLEQLYYIPILLVMMRSYIFDYQG